LCQFLAKWYDPQLGMRSLKKAVKDRIGTALDKEYMKTHDLIVEGGPMEDYVVFVTNGRVRVRRVMNKP
jgi:hypothetical protein